MESGYVCHPSEWSPVRRKGDRVQCGSAGSSHGILLRPAAIVLSLVAALSFLVLGGNAQGQQVQPREIYQKARGAVVFIVARLQVRLTVPDAGLNYPLLTEFVSTHIRKKSAERTPRTVSQALVEAFDTSLFSCFQPSTRLNPIEFAMTGTGSGFIVNPSGYIVTNAHVVTVSSMEIARHLFGRVKKENVQAIMKSLRSRFPELAKASENDLGTLEKTVKAGYAVYCAQESNKRVAATIVVLVRKETTSGEVISKKYPAEIVRAGTTGAGKKDVAVLKIEGAGFPVVQLGDDKRLSVGDQIYVVGFPGAAGELGGLADESLMEATITGGIVSAKKPTKEGWSALQTDAALNPGNSGGPAFDSTGKTIGIATWGVRKGGEQGINFLVPIGVAKQFLQLINVKWSGI